MQTKTGRLTRSTGTDVRAQADPQDFETTMRRPAKPPVDAFWQNGGTAVLFDGIIRIQDWDEPGNRFVNAKYRLYILGVDTANSTDPVLSSLGLQGSFRGATLMGEIPCSGRGGFIDVNVYNYPAATNVLAILPDAWVFIVGVNRFGEESEPMSPVRIKV